MPSPCGLIIMCDIVIFILKYHTLVVFTDIKHSLESIKLF